MPASTTPLVRRRRLTRPAAAMAAAFTISAAVAVGGATSAVAAPTPATTYRQTNLVSDIPGVARVTDPNLVNPWGLAAGPTTPLWVADNGTDVSTLYSGGVRGSIPVTAPLVVSIPGGAPTGTVFNPT